MGSFLVVTTTTGTEQDARRIARALVARRLAACVQVAGPIGSVYWWQGQIESASEWRCAAKTSAEQYPAVEQAIRELHAYEVPEIVATPIVAGSAAYLDWLAAEMAASPEGTGR